MRGEARQETAAPSPRLLGGAVGAGAPLSARLLSARRPALGVRLR